jgi:molybdopterin converting factor small subunit
MTLPDDEELESSKTSKALDEILDVLRKHKLRLHDLVLLYGNLGYSIGASIENIKDDDGPTLDELQKKYYEKPTIGISLMLQGMLTTTWIDDIHKTNDVKIEEKNEL